MTDEPKGTTLTGLDEEILLSGSRISVAQNGKSVNLTRKIAITQALDKHSGTTKEDKLKAYELARESESANGQILLNHEEAAMIKAAIEANWGQPGIYVPLCRWLEGA